MGRKVVEETWRGWEWGEWKKKGISHLASERAVGDTKRQKPEERTSQRERKRGTGAVGREGEMAQHLRLYFGSGRSNTAPEILEGDSEEQQADSDVVTGIPMQPSLLSQEPPRPLGLRTEPSLKRSSSMFIPQLAAYTEPRPTKSSSMHISLQRANGSSHGDFSGYADDVPPPCYTPPGPAPAYSEPLIQADVPRYSPPPSYNPDFLNSQTFVFEPNLPKRRVFSIGSNGHILYSTGQTGISVSGVCVQRRSPDGSDIQHLRILPHGSAGWSVQQQSLEQRSHVSGGTQRLVFQLQQNQNQGMKQKAASQEECTEVDFSTSSSGRIIRYPRLQLGRSLSHQRLLLENQHQNAGAVNEIAEDTQPNTETLRMDARNRSNGCTFKISGDTPGQQPHFKIYFTPGGAGDKDVGLGNDLMRTNPKVKTLRSF